MFICACFTCPGGSGRLICTYVTCPRGSREVQLLTNLRRRVGPLPKHLRPEAFEALRLAEARVLQPRALRVQETRGGSFARVLRVLGLWEAHLCVFYVSGGGLEGRMSNVIKVLGGTPS